MMTFTGSCVHLRNYAEVHGISLPGRIPGMKSYEKYVKSCERLHLKACAQTTFNMLWRCYLPFIEKIKPISDLYATCTGLIIRSANIH